MDPARLQDLLAWADESERDGATPAAIARVVRARIANAEADRADIAEAKRWAKAAQNDRSAAMRSRARGLLALTREVVPREQAKGGPRPEPRRRTSPPRTQAPRVWLGRHAKSAVVVLAGGALAIAFAAVAMRAAEAALRPSLSVDGLSSGAAIGRARLATLAFASNGKGSALEKQHWTLDGRDVTSQVRSRGTRLVFRPRRLDDGEHALEITQDGILGTSAHDRVSFTVDLTPPELRVQQPLRMNRWRPLQIDARTEPRARVTINGRPARVDGAGRVTASLAPPIPAKVTAVVADEAGNRATERLPVSIVPRRPSAPVRAVHVTAYGWADDSLRHGVLRLIAEHRINAIEIDLKDEGGLAGFDPPVALARRVGAAQPIYDLRRLVAQMHARGIRVIGRLVCFRDPLLAKAAWRHGRRDEVVQAPNGGPYSGYGGFTNFANPVVRKYNIDIAVAAARAGVDDVLYDYVRRPDGPLGSMVFPGLHAKPSRAIVEFLRETRLALRPFGTYFGVSVFGVAATRPDEVAQDIPQMAREADYVAPMVYPSHWSPGEYNVPNPNGQPYAIVARSLRDFKRHTRNTGARIVPWLQDFTLGVAYGPAEVRAQIDAAQRDGIHEFLLWDPLVTYTSDALAQNAPLFSGGLAKPTTTTAAAAAAHKPRPKALRVRAVKGRKPNELGVIPVIMHHEIRPDRVGAFDQTPAEFRAELEKLWRQGYWPVTAAALASGRLGSVPAGKTPVVLTFDDSTQFQFFYTASGDIKATTAIGVMRAFARAHPKFKIAGTFYVLREPFAGTQRAPAMLRWLVAHGFELGDHTHDHIPLNTLGDAGVQRELVQGGNVITDAVPGYRIRTMALPLGALPRKRALALRGTWHRQSYRFAAAFLAGAEPAPSPFSTKFDRAAVPRIRTSHLPWHGERDFCTEFWLHELEQHPESRYVSDGDPHRLTFPRSRRKYLITRFRPLANAY
ncbi:MAG: putative glycoside hydrolase [Gaiellaceae bacterium]